VDAQAERGVAVFRPVEDDLVGPFEVLGVAVGGGERQQHPVAPGQVLAGQLDVLGDEAGHGA